MLSGSAERSAKRCAERSAERADGRTALTALTACKKIQRAPSETKNKLKFVDSKPAHSTRPRTGRGAFGPCPTLAYESLTH